MLYRTADKHALDDSYQKTQEQILTTLIGQVGSGYTAARLQIMLRHTQDSMPAVSTVTAPAAAL